MKIYFAGSIRGGREDVHIYEQMIFHLQSKAQVLTEHVGDKDIIEKEAEVRRDVEIYERDLEWLTQSDAVIAEVTTPSLGVGYEIGRAEAMGKPILCLYRDGASRKLSAMISGAPKLKVKTYRTSEEARKIMDDFVETLSSI